ncbi:ergothioneine biosynthesis protein EgtB [Sandaracinus amylolyticus]|uniref:ergothioneine biosynthesis protein EgtB n=1 Tax=Sandaracinus amylolyticus TaxID=927083 RepID=UPI001F26CE60|nr:ergothioneine biosynthesis protein EgtB [Sandaracinus amylolyticus]UJR78638.1 Ergothioneine biosynthesis protein EgtB [Sandaracinus amylolyticus]
MAVDRDALRARYDAVRARTEALVGPLGVDEQLAQAFADASPTKWHLAHTTWFFERFVLRAFASGHEPVDARYDYLFNSYYEAVGARQPRAERGLIVRPTLPEAHEYRRRVDDAMRRFFARADDATFARAVFAIELGTHHEEQHQELILTDVKPLLAASPMRVAYARAEREEHCAPASLEWIAQPGGLVEIGARREDGFAFDNEGPRHRVWLDAFELASRCVTSGEYLAFVEDGGYQTPALWLSDGWAHARANDWSAPMYWERDEHGAWHERTLRGRELLDRDAPVSHLSFYEADAYARWAGARLPSEAEWEAVASSCAIDGNFVESGRFHPRAARERGLTQTFGDVWEWTSSAYAPYPRYAPFGGAFAEYNGKFMCSQLVLRGGSCLSPRAHLRATYRNFFPPSARWQMTGLRLARWTDV